MLSVASASAWCQNSAKSQALNRETMRKKFLDIAFGAMKPSSFTLLGCPAGDYVRDAGSAWLGLLLRLVAGSSDAELRDREYVLRKLKEMGS